ncbi:MAG: PAS domain-containing protein [Candidatus Eisenbacteria bacterium]|nr:PAS domain-containing protein [Candidatus Eisenbacteria bacterium]
MIVPENDAVTERQHDCTADAAGVKPAVLSAILDSLVDPVLFADTDHIIRYMNRSAVAHYSEGSDLIGRSIMECHNESSQAVIREVLEAMGAGEDERLITDNERHRIFMRAVRDPDGRVIGYYERYAPPHRETVDDRA